MLFYKGQQVFILKSQEFLSTIIKYNKKNEQKNLTIKLFRDVRKNIFLLT